MEMYKYEHENYPCSNRTWITTEAVCCMLFQVYSADTYGYVSIPLLTASISI